MSDEARVGVASVIMGGDYVLLGKRKAIHAHGLWSCPGGHLEFMESFEDAAIRETKEETGMIIPKGRFKLWTVENTLFPDENKHYVVVFMTAVWSSEFGMPVNAEPDKCEGWGWFAWDRLPSPLINGLKQLKQANKTPFGTQPY